LCSAGNGTPRARERRTSSTSRESDSSRVHDSSRVSQSALIRAERVEEGLAKGDVGDGVAYGGTNARRVGVRKGRASGFKNGWAGRSGNRVSQAYIGLVNAPLTIVFELFDCPPSPI
jgi:hypothetical protein